MHESKPVAVRTIGVWLSNSLFSLAIFSSAIGAEDLSLEQRLEKAVSAAEYFQGGPLRAAVIAQLEEVKKAASDKNMRLEADFHIASAILKWERAKEPDYDPCARMKKHLEYVEQEYADRKYDIRMIDMRLSLFPFLKTHELVAASNTLNLIMCVDLPKATYPEGSARDEKQLCQYIAAAWHEVWRRIYMEKYGATELEGANHAVKSLETSGAPAALIDFAKYLRGIAREQQEMNDRIKKFNAEARAGRTPMDPKAAHEFLLRMKVDSAESGAPGSKTLPGPLSEDRSISHKGDPIDPNKPVPNPNQPPEKTTLAAREGFSPRKPSPATPMPKPAVKPLENAPAPEQAFSLEQIYSEVPVFTLGLLTGLVLAFSVYKVFKRW